MKGQVLAAMIAAAAVIIAAIIGLLNPGILCDLTGLGCQPTPDTEITVEWEAWRYAYGEPDSVTTRFKYSTQFPKKHSYVIEKGTKTLYSDETVTFLIEIDKNGSYKGIILDNSRGNPGEVKATSDLKVRDVRVNHDPGDIFLIINKVE